MLRKRDIAALVLLGVVWNAGTPSPGGAGFFDPQGSTSDTLGPDWQKIVGGMGYQGCLLVSTNLNLECMGNGSINADSIYILGKPAMAVSTLPTCASPCTTAPVAAGAAYINQSGFVVIAQP